MDIIEWKRFRGTEKQIYVKRKRSETKKIRHNESNEMTGIFVG